MYYLGLDIATYRTGWCVAKVENHKIKSIQKGTLFLPEAPLPKRLLELQNQVTILKKNYQLEPILFKEQPLHSKRSNIISAAMFKAHGVVEAVFHDFEPKDVNPVDVKKLMAGNGHATKKQVEQGVRGWLKLPNEYEFYTDDESDAVGILITGLMQKNKINGIKVK
ncbi:crossover junction endodeoxyribonuclease RuvC [Bacillaceae bacterium S4-13-58]